MNKVYGYIKYNTSKKVHFDNSAIKIDDWAEVFIDQDETEFIKKFETEKIWIVMTGYIEQPLDAEKIDLEKIVLDYEVTGELPEEYLYGSFQILFIDKVTKSVKLFCDRGGLRNWYLYEDSDICYFGTKIHIFKMIFNIEVQPNIADRDFSLIFGYYPNNHTVYNNVVKLNGNQFMQVEKQKSTIELFCKVKDTQHRSFRNEDEIIDTLYEKFMLALENQVDGQDKVAVHLGGFDSALMASMLKRMGKEVETFTFFYENDDGEFNQAHTDTLANYLGIKHNWIPITASIYKNIFSRYKHYFDQPTNWPNYVIQTEYLTEKCKEYGFKTIISGDGADSIFQGYPGVNRSAKLYNRISPYIKPISGLLINTLNSKFLEKKMGHVYRLIMRVIRNARISDPIRTFLMFRIFDETTIAHIFNENSRQVEEKIALQLEQIKNSIPKDTSTNKLAYMGRSNMGPNRLKLSSSMDATGIPIFSPFMHNEIKSLVMSFPDELMRPEGSGNAMSDIGKYILTKMTQKFELLPDEIIFQKKQSPVNSPIDDWYECEFQDMIASIIEQSPWKVDENFIKSMSDKKSFEELYKNSYGADRVTSHALSLFLTTVTFYDKRDSH